MRGLKWIRAWSEQHLKDEIENLLPDNDVIFNRYRVIEENEKRNLNRIISVTTIK